MIELLLEAGADPSSKNNNGNTAASRGEVVQKKTGILLYKKDRSPVFFEDVKEGPCYGLRASFFLKDSIFIRAIKTIKAAADKAAVAAPK